MQQHFNEPQRRAEYQKWDCLTLADFRSKSSWNWISYVWLWILALISVAVYGSDTFTAVQLLAFNNWSSQIKPYIAFDISKWIFAGCILFSWVLLAYEWFRAIRVMQRGNVAESYLDNLAVVLQSMRLGGVGKGWRRFLVFTALTKSKKGADYVALFSYFQFKGAVRVILAEGPRQVINALTLYSVMVANLIPAGSQGHSSSGSSIEQFWKNIQILYDDKREQAIILSTMLFTLIIWVFSALCLLASCLVYIGFLWHYIPREDGTLGKYCRRKVNTRLERIVNAKAKDDLAAEEARRRKAEEKAAASQPDAFMPKPVRQPTLPSVTGQDDPPLDPSISRTSNESMPPPYPGVQQSDGRQPSLPQLSDEIKPPPRLFRSDSESTIASNISYGPQPTLPQLHDAPSQVALLQDDQSQYPSRPPPLRMDTQSTVASNISYGPRKPLPMPNGPYEDAQLPDNQPQDGRWPSQPLRMGSQSTVASNVSYGPRPPLPPMPNGRRPPPGPTRMGSQSTTTSHITYGPPVRSPDEYTSPVDPFSRRPSAPGRSYTQSSGFSNASDMPLLDRSDPVSPNRNFSRMGPPQQRPEPAYEMSAQRSASVPPQQLPPPQPQPQGQPPGGYRPYSPANASRPPPRSESRTGPSPGPGRGTPRPPGDRMYEQF